MDMFPNVNFQVMGFYEYTYKIENIYYFFKRKNQIKANKNNILVYACSQPFELTFSVINSSYQLTFSVNLRKVIFSVAIYCKQ